MNIDIIMDCELVGIVKRIDGEYKIEMCKQLSAYKISKFISKVDRAILKMEELANVE